MGTIKPDSKRSDQNPITLRTHVLHLLPHTQHGLPTAALTPRVGTCHVWQPSLGFIWSSLNFVVTGMAFIPTAAWYTSLMCKGKKATNFISTSPWHQDTGCESLRPVAAAVRGWRQKRHGAFAAGCFKVQSQGRSCWEFVLGVVVKWVCHRDPRTEAMIFNATEAAVLREW